MKTLHSTWPFKVMKSKWRVSKLCKRQTFVISEATGHIILEVDCDGTCEKNLAMAREIAQHVVDLHNSQLGK